MTRNSFLLLFCLFIATSCEDGPRTQVRAAEFITIQGCLAGIEKDAGTHIDKIARDKPAIVTGFLANGEQFACEIKTTGTKGTYYYGWYTLPVNTQ